MTMNISNLLSIVCFTYLFSFQLSAQIASTQKITSASSSPSIKVENCTPANSQDLEFSPAYYHDGLVFVTSRLDEGPSDEKIAETFFELFYADIAPDGTLREPRFFSAKLNSRLHEGPVAFNQNFTNIYFTRSNFKDDKPVKSNTGGVHLQIYKAEKSPMDWTNFIKLSFNSDDYSCAHPSLSYDEQKLYFSSDMPGGFGGMDLYVVEKEGNSWGKPLNLGAEINTTGNEIFPFIHGSGELFFSSDGHAGLGGLDLFKIELNIPNAKVVALGEPFNSPEDDLGIVLNAENKAGYFTSSRGGGEGKDDLYRFETKESLFGKMKEEVAITLKDEDSKKVLEGVEIRIFESNADGTLKNNDLYDVELVPSPHNPDEMTLRMVRKSPEQLGEPDVVIGTAGTADLPLKKGRHYIIIASKEGYETKEIFHSTMNGTDLESLDLSLVPLPCVVLKGKVINANTGAAIPAAVVQIISDCDGEEMVTYSNLNGEFTHCLPSNCEVTIRVTKGGYDPALLVVSIPNDKTPISALLELIPANESLANQPLKKGSVIILDKIYYDFDKSAIRTRAARDLDALVTIMKRYPSMEIELVAHTDNRGTEAYNLDLSLRRAESAEDYLAARGIAKQRVKTFGYGEALPRSHCTHHKDCNEPEHQRNRRTEIRIVEIDEPVEVEYQHVEPTFE